jgi:hypothetical protein
VSTVYSTRFISGLRGTAGSYTVPAGYRAVVRSVTAINLYSSTSEPAQLRSSVGGLIIVGAYLSTFVSSPPWNAITWDLHYVANAGEGIYTQNGPDVDMTVSGYLLTLP